MRLHSNNYANSKIQTKRVRSRLYSGNITPPVTAWIPSAKTGLLFWFDATQGVITDGSNNVTQWTDISGNNQNAIGVIPTFPAYVTNTQNGLPGIVFNEAMYLDFGTAANYKTAQEFSLVAIVLHRTSAGTYYHTICAVASGTLGVNFNNVISNDPAYGNWFWGEAAAGGANGVGVATADFTAACGLINYTGTGPNITTNYGAYLNNSAQAIMVSSVNGNTAAENYIGSYGNTSPPSFGFKGAILEVFAYGGVGAQFSAADRANLKTYVQTKWNIAQANMSMMFRAAVLAQMIWNRAKRLARLAPR